MPSGGGAVTGMLDTNDKDVSQFSRTCSDTPHFQYARILQEEASGPWPFPCMASPTWLALGAAVGPEAVLIEFQDGGQDSTRSHTTKSTVGCLSSLGLWKDHQRGKDPKETHMLGHWAKHQVLGGLHLGVHRALCKPLHKRLCTETPRQP